MISRKRGLRLESLENRELLAADLISQVAPTAAGDADLSGRFDSADLVRVFQAGKYETGDLASWAEGDWNGDKVFDSADLVFAFQADDYTNPAKADNTRVDVTRTAVMPFQQAGDVGGGVLTPGDQFAPTKGGHATFRTGDDWVSYNVHTTGLPAGAFTNWLIVFGNPDGCVDNGCGEDDVVAAVNAAIAGSTTPADVSILWSDGGIVRENGVGNFHTKIDVGDAPGEVILPGSWMDGIDLKSAEFHIVIKYHGPASDDPDVLYDQTHTLLGSCDFNANAITVSDLPDPIQTQCFDPQAVVIRPVA